MSRYDRTGEPIEDDDPAPTTATQAHDPTCRGGWLGEDDDGRLVPCLTCRPWIAERRQHLARLLAGPNR
ncbi:UNVERIFIED_ORG: hypothetical protein E4P37_03440 [Bacillus sp. AZ43]